MNLFTITTPVCLLVFSIGITFPNCMAKALAIFPEMSGSATAVMGLIFVFAAMITSIVASLLRPATQTPMMWLYTAIAVFSLLIYWTMLRTPKPPEQSS